MWTEAPHVLPYQGSKRKLAERILEFCPADINCLYEPFAGSAAVSLAAAANHLSRRVVISDKLQPLAALWSMVIDQPEQLIAEYSAHWNKQHDDSRAYFAMVRDMYNKTKSPSALLYLIARCVKNSVRFNSKGEFNQGPDNRRLGLRPEKLAIEVAKANALLKKVGVVKSGDFREVLKDATANDLVYMDPPWQGTSGKRDPRYAFLLDMDELIAELARLNERGIPFILSFDGACGDRTYGADLPETLELKRVSLVAGRSSQATLLGRNEITVESLYLSSALVEKLEESPNKRKHVASEQLLINC